MSLVSILHTHTVDYSKHTHTHTHSVVLTVSNVENDAAAVRDEQTERLGGITLQTDTHAHI